MVSTYIPVHTHIALHILKGYHINIGLNNRITSNCFSETFNKFAKLLIIDNFLPTSGSLIYPKCVI